MVAQTHRSQNFGHELVKYSLEKAGEHFNGVPIKISAQSHLVPFYNVHGFKTLGEEYLEDGIPHIAMTLEYEFLPTQLNKDCTSLIKVSRGGDFCPLNKSIPEPENRDSGGNSLTAIRNNLLMRFLSTAF